MSGIEGVVAFFKALPELIALLSRLGALLESLLAYAHQNDINGFLDNVEKNVDGLKNAKTKNEKLNAAQNLVDLVRNIGPK
jgi:hypothetical protein